MQRKYWSGKIYFMPIFLQRGMNARVYELRARNPVHKRGKSKPGNPTDPITLLKPQNPSTDVSEVQKVGLSPDFEALDLWKGRSWRERGRKEKKKKTGEICVTDFSLHDANTTTTITTNVRQPDRQTGEKKRRPERRTDRQTIRRVNK